MFYFHFDVTIFWPWPLMFMTGNHVTQIDGRFVRLGVVEVEVCVMLLHFVVYTRCLSNQNAMAEFIMYWQSTICSTISSDFLWCGNFMVHVFLLKWTDFESINCWVLHSDSNYLLKPGFYSFWSSLNTYIWNFLWRGEQRWCTVEISTPLWHFPCFSGKSRIHGKRLSRQAVLFPYFKIINPIISLPLQLTALPSFMKINNAKMKS